MERYLAIKHPWVDSSLAPLYQVTFPASTSDEKLLSYCRAIASWSTQVMHPVGWLMDLSRVQHVSAQQRAIFARYMRGMEDFDRRCTKASALVLPNALLRGVATAIFWLYAPRFLHRIFAEAGEGQAWLRDVLWEAGVDHIPRTASVPLQSLRPQEHTIPRPSSAHSARPPSADSAARERTSSPPRERGSAPSNGETHDERRSARPNQR